MRYSLIILLTLSFTLQAEDAKPQPLEVTQAMAALEKSIVAARKVYDPIVTKAVNDAVLKLNLVKADYMKKVDLEGANMIVDAIAKLKEGSVVGEIEEHAKSMNNMKLFANSGIVGKWHIQVESGWSNICVISDDMTVMLEGRKGAVTFDQEKNNFTLIHTNGVKYANLKWKKLFKSLVGDHTLPDGKIECAVVLTRLPSTK